MTKRLLPAAWLLALSLAVSCTNDGTDREDAERVELGSIEQATHSSTPPPPGFPDSGCKLYTYNGSRYFYCERQREWADARNRCKAVGMDLTVIETAGEDDFIKVFNGDHAWIGGAVSSSSTQWTWQPFNQPFWNGDEDGAPIGGAYTNFDGGEPEVGSAKCLAKEPRSVGGNWESFSCGITKDYICEETDLCPSNPNKTLPGSCGCALPETDTDKDGAPDCVDWCPNDAAKKVPGPCPCGATCPDSDGDKTIDVVDECDNDPGNTLRGDCGCKGEAGQPPVGTPCDDGICPGHFSCDANAQCGDRSCVIPGSSATRSPDRSSCAIYMVVPAAASWTSADTICRQRGGRWLADVNSSSQNAEIRALLNRAGINGSAWLGGNDRAVNGAWRFPRWVDNNGQQFWSGSASGARVGSEYANWAPGMPATGDCTAIGADGKWQSVSCATSLPYVCRAYDHNCLETPVNLPPIPTPTPVIDPEPANCVSPASTPLGSSFDFNGPEAKACVTGGTASCEVCSGGSCNAAVDSLEGSLVSQAGTTPPALPTSCPGIPASEQTADPRLNVQYGDVGDLSKCGLAAGVFDGVDLGPLYNDGVAGGSCSTHSDCSYLANTVPYQGIIANAGLVNPLFICVPVSGDNCKAGKNGCATIPVSDSQGTGFLPERRCHLAAFEEVDAHTLTDAAGRSTSIPKHKRTSCLDDPSSASGQPANTPERCSFVDLCSPPGAKGNSVPDPTLLPTLTPDDPEGLPAAGVQLRPSTTFSELTCAGKPTEDNTDCYCDLAVNNLGKLENKDSQVGDPKNSKIINIKFDPTINYNLDIDPMPFGEGKFKIGAQGGLDLTASLFGAQFTIVKANAEVALTRCSLKWERTLDILAPPLGALAIGEYFIDNYVHLPAGFDTGSATSTGPLRDASKACSDALDGFQEAADRLKKSYRDATSLVKEYRDAIKAGKKFDRRTFCTEMVRYPGLEGFPSLPCVKDDPVTTTIDESLNNALPEEIVNSFIEHYNGKLATLKGSASSTLRQATDALRSAQDTISGLTFSGTFPKERKNYGDNFGGTVLEFPFAIGPIPMVFSLDVFANYGITQPYFKYKLDPSAAAGALACAALDPALCENQSELASVSLEFGPNAGAGASVFVGAGFSINGFSLTLGVTGDLNLIRVGAPVNASAALTAGVKTDTRAIPAALAMLSSRPDRPLDAAKAAIPNIHATYGLGWSIGGKIVLSDILRGTVSARLRLKLKLFFVTLRFEYKQRLFEFPGFGPKEYVLFKAGGSMGALPVNLGPAYADTNPPAGDKEDLGVVETRLPFIELQPVRVPSPTTLLKDLLPAGISLTDLPAGFTGNETYQALQQLVSDPDKLGVLGYERQCLPPPPPG